MADLDGGLILVLRSFSEVGSNFDFRSWLRAGQSNKNLNTGGPHIMRMKYIHLTAILLVSSLFIPSLFAIQYLGGSIKRDMTLKRRSGPYVIRSDVTVAKNVTLTIEQGTTVLLVPTSDGKKTAFSTENTDLIIFGKLVATGTFAAPVSIGSSDKNAWGAIYFTSKSSADSELKNCNITKGRIIINGSSPRISYCNIWGGGGIEVGYNSQPQIRNNNIYYNSVGIHYWVKSSGAQVVNNYIVYNRYGILLTDFDAKMTKIENNNIYGNLDYDLSLEATKDLKAPNNFWGSRDGSKVSKKIFDSFDRSQLGEVKFLPLRPKENILVWKLKLNPNITAPGEISDLEITVPRGKTRPPIGFFQLAGRRIGIRPRFGIIFPVYDTGYFDFSVEVMPAIWLKLVYDECWSMDVGYESANFSSNPGIYAEEYSEINYSSFSMAFLLRPLKLRTVSPFVSAGIGLYRMHYKNRKYLGKTDPLDSPLKPSAPKTSTLGLNAALGGSVYFQHRFEVDLELKYIGIQSEDNLERPVNPSFLVLSVSALMFF